MNLVPHGVSPTRYGRTAMWARRREKYGRTGHSAEAQASLQRQALLMQSVRRKLFKGARTCPQGHTWTKENTRWSPATWCTGGMRRICRTCYRLRKIRKREQRQLAEKTEQARLDMIAAGVRMHQHPDSAYWRDRAVASRDRWLSLKGRAA